MSNEGEYVQAVLSGLLRVPGYVEDVAKHMIRLARQHGPNCTVECRYGRIFLHARADSTVDEIRRSFERQHAGLRLSRRLRLVC